MKKITALALTLWLTGCSSFSYHSSPLQAQQVEPFSMRMPATVRLDLGEKPDQMDIAVKQALLQSGVITENSGSERTLSIRTTFVAHENYLWVLTLLSLGTVPSVVPITYTTDLQLTEPDGSHAKYQYVTTLQAYEWWLAPLAGREWEASKREFGAIVGSHFLNDANRSNAL